MAIRLHRCTKEIETTEMRLVERFRPKVRPAASTTPRVAPTQDGLAWEGASGNAYDEQSFRFFLEAECRRSEANGCSGLLLLVEFKSSKSNIDEKLAARIFASLSRCLRETDFFGWYRDGRVIGAVLTQPGTLQEQAGSQQVGERISKTIRESLERGVASEMHLRLMPISSESNGWSTRCNP